MQTQTQHTQTVIAEKLDDSAIKYCDDFICTYHMHDEEDQDDIYKCQIIQAFMIEDWYDDGVNKTVQKLYNEFTNETNPHYLENTEQMERLYEKLDGYLFPSIYSNSNSNIANNQPRTKERQFALFQCLFGFDYFFKTHTLICNFLNKKIISSTIIDEILKITY